MKMILANKVVVKTPRMTVIQRLMKPTRLWSRLRDQFNQLFVEFTRDKKHEHGHELTVLLDEMLERGSIAPLEYNRLNSDTAILEKSSDEGAEEEDEMTRVIEDTVANVILHDKEELSDLLVELRDEVGKRVFRCVT